MKKHFLTLGSFLIFGVATLTAQETPRVDARQENQKNRIKEGVKSGELTRKETANLIEDKKRIKRMESKAKANGTVSVREKARIENAQDKVSKEIYRKKHNDRSIN